MLRHFGQFENRRVGQIRDAFEPIDLRHHRARSRVDDDEIGVDLLRGTVGRLDGQRSRPCKAPVSLEDREIVRTAQPFLDARAGAADHLVLARLHTRHVDADVAADHHAVLRRRARDMRGPRARDISLGRRATDVHAGAAKKMPLDDGRALAAFREPHGKRRTALPRTDHDCVEVL